MNATPRCGTLLYCESGRTHPLWLAEATRWQWLRKTFVLDPSMAASMAAAQLWMLLAGPTEPAELEFWWNGRRLTAPPAPAAGQIAWTAINVPADQLQTGVNRLELRAEQPAMTGWALAFEPCPQPENSLVSLDRGETWHDRAVGPNHMLAGEFVARLRLATDGTRSEPPAVVYEDANHPRVRELLELIPDSITGQSDPWQQILALRGWVAGLWPYNNRGVVVAPWDAWTIAPWGHGHHRHGDQGVVTMCVHYTATFCALASALGHAARCVSITPGLNTAHGHFVAEVFDRNADQWVMQDANFDMHFYDGRPLSICDLTERATAGVDCTALAQLGLNTPASGGVLGDVGREFFFTGRSYRHVAVYRRNDFTSQPAAAPPAHGKVPYCETDLLWYTPDPASAAAFNMFPHHINDRAWFDAAP